MKRIVLSLATLFFPALLLFLTPTPTLAQGDPGTDDDGFVLLVNSPSFNQTIPHRGNAGPGQCYWTGSTYGPSLTEDVCGELAWAYDQTPDSLACDPIPGDLTGKVALIRRGVCNFSLKVYRAQQAGAVAVVILNHFSNAPDGDCINYVPTGQQFGGMSGGDSMAAVVIPSVFLQRQTGRELDAALKKGETVEVCFSLPRMQNAAIAYHYATPLSQVDSLGAIYVEYVNRSADVQENVVVSVEINDPDNVKTTLNFPIAKMNPGQDTAINFPPYKPASKLGKFTATFRNNKFTQPRDVLTRTFYHTPSTFATDNLTVDPLGVGLSNADFTNGAGLAIQNANLYFTGPNGGKATHASFGIANVDSLFVPGDPTANQILINLYDADQDENGENDLDTDFTSLDGNIVAQAIYTMTGTEPVDSVFSVALLNFEDPNILGATLKPRHPYYLSLFYDGSGAGTGRCIRFSNTLDELYVHAFATPLFTDRLYGGGWSGAEVITRLQLDGFNPSVVNTQNLLDKSKIEIAPNPANELVRMNLKLDGVNPTVRVSMFDAFGRVVRSDVQRNFQSGTLDLNVKDVPSGVYSVWVRTWEGSHVQRISVCH